MARGELREANVEGRQAFAQKNFQTRARRAERALDACDDRLRLLAPFDPVIRDRDRASRLFGFDYRFEAYVPAPKRVYGYYVLPILQGDRFVGRCDLKTDRKRGKLEVKGLWWEDGRARDRQRLAKFDEALSKLEACALDDDS